MPKRTACSGSVAPKQDQADSSKPKVTRVNADFQQSDRFIETARKLGCDEDETAFREALGRIAREKPKGQIPAAPKDEKS